MNYKQAGTLARRLMQILRPAEVKKWFKGNRINSPVILLAVEIGYNPGRMARRIRDKADQARGRCLYFHALRLARIAQELEQ